MDTIIEWAIAKAQSLSPLSIWFLIIAPLGILFALWSAWLVDSGWFTRRRELKDLYRKRRRIRRLTLLMLLELAELHYRARVKLLDATEWMRRDPWEEDEH